MFVAGVLAAIAIGVALGLLGGGGSLLTVPTIHYLFGVEAHAAIASSLLIVGTTAATTLVSHLRAGRVRVRIGLVFGVSSMVSSYGAGRLTSLVPPGVLLVGFAVVAAIAAVAMLRPRRELFARDAAVGRLVLAGLGLGAITGFVGAGGGFLIVPALIVLVGLSMQEAAATSLLVIAMSSFSAFAATARDVALDGRVVGVVLVAAIAGGLAGSKLSARIPASQLRRWFGWFVLILAIAIFGAELPRMLRG
jgi:hypothetical protein